MGSSHTGPGVGGRGAKLCGSQSLLFKVDSFAGDKSSRCRIVDLPPRRVHYL